MSYIRSRILMAPYQTSLESSTLFKGCFLSSNLNDIPFLEILTHWIATIKWWTLPRQWNFGASVQERFCILPSHTFITTPTRNFFNIFMPNQMIISTIILLHLFEAQINQLQSAKSVNSAKALALYSQRWPAFISSFGNTSVTKALLPMHDIVLRKSSRKCYGL